MNQLVQFGSQVKYYKNVVKYTGEITSIKKTLICPKLCHFCCHSLILKEIGGKAVAAIPWTLSGNVRSFNHQTWHIMFALAHNCTIWIIHNHLKLLFHNQLLIMMMMMMMMIKIEMIMTMDWISLDDEPTWPSQHMPNLCQAAPPAVWPCVKRNDDGLLFMFSQNLPAAYSSLANSMLDQLYFAPPASSCCG